MNCAAIVLLSYLRSFISTTWNASTEAQTRRSDEAVASTLNATLVGREVANEVIRDHADDMRSIALLEACDQKDLAAPLRDKFRPDWRRLAEQRIKPKRSCRSTSCQ